MREGRRSVRNGSMSIVSQTRPSQRSFSRLSYGLSKGFRLLTYYYLCQLFSWKEISFARKETRKWKKSKERTKSMHARNVYVSPVSPWKDDIVEGFSSDLEMIHFLETGRGEGGRKKRKNWWTMNLRRRRAIGRGYAPSG